MTTSFLPRVQPATRRVAVKKIPHALAPAETFELFRNDSHPFFLDSGSGVERLGRFSFMGSQPFLVVVSKGKEVRVEEDGQQHEEVGSPFEVLRTLLSSYRVEYSDRGIPLIGGAVGYFGYDLCHFLEKLPDSTEDDIALPDMCFGFYGELAAFDHYTNQWRVAAIDTVHRSAEDAVEKLAARITSFAGGHTPQETPASQMDRSISSDSFQCNFTREEYLAAVRRVKEYIAAGDIFQVNLSQRFAVTLNISPYELYRRLRAINPAPFAAFLQFKEGAIVSSSPERFLQLRNGHVETRPIKGTRPRTDDEEFNARMREELLASAKDRAELTMIVDLERNDIGKVCSYGTVKVKEKCVLEEYPTVYHLVATVEGDLHEEKDAIDLIKAAFPGGSITGAPKVRAMEIIEELEPTKRGPYTGGIGYIGFDGSMDMNIAIRTFAINGRAAYFQAGGGIVADSDPEAEYQETLDKANALFNAVAKNL